MKLPSRPPRRSSLRWLTPTPLLALALGCASPGPPHPPSLQLPEHVTDLTAQRIGDQVRLHWTTPTRTTDGIDLKGSLTAEICRSQPTSASPCTPVAHLPVHPGPTDAVDSLPPILTADPITLLAYRVQIFNPHHRSAGQSSPTFSAAGASPPSVEQLRATATRNGTLLEWQPQPASSPTSQVNLDRQLVAAPAPPRPTPKSAAKQPLQLSSKPQTEVRLQTPSNQTPGQPSDPGGTLDHTALKGQTYRYTAQRVRTTPLGGHQLELRSLSSPAITLLFSDTFPPDVPTGLAAIPGEATATGHPSIDLSWQSGDAPDLAGYRVYRQQVTAGSLTGATERLTPSPILAAAFHDPNPNPNQRYAYRVTAVDTAGNESAPSADAQETAREQ
ncbi:MAG TPA: fibronectin type III domain-containing protein [Edaphobacter sp.]|nr:fibronectin type III domain-containing protein [Edaphobacter sp.]